MIPSGHTFSFANCLLYSRVGVYFHLRDHPSTYAQEYHISNSPPYTNVHQNNFKHLSVVLISRCFHAYIIYQKFRQKDFWRKIFGGKIFGQLLPISTRKKFGFKKMWTAFYFCYFLNELSSLINR
jgi:hypothetical protein